MPSPIEKNIKVVPTKPPIRARESHLAPASMSHKTGYHNLKIANRIARDHGGVYIMLHAFDDHEKQEEDQCNLLLANISNKSVDEEAEAETRLPSHYNPLTSSFSTLSDGAVVPESNELDTQYVIYHSLIYLDS